MANKKISDFTSKPTPAAGDMFVLADKDSANYFIKSSDLKANILGTLPTDVSTNTSNISLNVKV